MPDPTLLNLMRGMIAALAAGAVVAMGLCAVPANADEDAFVTEVLRAGVPAEHVMTFQFWAPTACQMAKRMHVSDAEAITYMQTDVDDVVMITPEQAALIWDSAKRNIC